MILMLYILLLYLMNCHGKPLYNGENAIYYKNILCKCLYFDLNPFIFVQSSVEDMFE